MKIVFMGTPEFSVPTLKSIIDSEHEIIAVVTQPDKPKGRGKEMSSTPVKEAALMAGIPVYQPARVKEESFLAIIRQMKPDVIVVVAFGQILPKALLDIPKYGCINVHASLLPKYRGAAPIQWAVINGEKEAGITAMYMEEGLDTGDMLMKVTVPVEDKETGGSLHDKLSLLGGDLILRTLKALEDGTAVRSRQDESRSSYVKMLTKAMGCLDFNQDAVKLERLIRGLNPWPSAYTSLNGKTLKIWDASVVDHEYSGETGEIVEVLKDALVVKTNKGALAIKELQIEGKKRMTAEAYLRGCSISTGTKLG